MKGKLMPKQYRSDRSSSSSSNDSKKSKSSSSSSHSNRRRSEMKHNDKYKRRSRSSEKRSYYSRSYSSSSSSSSSERSPKRNQKYNHAVKKQKYSKRDDVYSGIKVKDEPLSDDDGRHRSRFSSSTSRRQENDSRRNQGHSKYKKVHIKKERWGSGQDKEPEWGKKSDREKEGEKGKKPLVDKAKPDFGLSGKLTEETNMYNGVVIKYSEPPEARKPKRRWRLYPFKGEQGLPTLFIHRQSAYLIGRDRKVADLPVDHPSCSKQHAALQYRLVPFKREDGMSGKRICPYIIDLESANGTFVNNKKIDPKKYVELMERDVIKFGFSSREYVLLHEHSKDGNADDDME